MDREPLSTLEPPRAPDPLALPPPGTSKFYAVLYPLLRLVLYILVVAVLWTVRNVILELFFHGQLSAPVQLFLDEFTSFAVVYGAAMILAKVERRPVGVYGLPMAAPAGRHFPRHFLQGCVFGLCEISALIGLIAVFGGYSFGSFALQGAAVLRWGLAWAIVFLFVGLFEEFAFRGYTLHALAESFGFWPAAMVLALYFGFAHSRNPGEALAGELGVVSIALLFALTLRRTGTLWLAVGWHAAFDFGETFLYSVPNSGAVFPGHLSSSSLHGPTWLTGGATGPEGSVFSFAVMAALAIAFHFLYPPAAAPPAPPTLSQFAATPPQVSPALSAMPLEEASPSDDQPRS